MKKPRKTKPVPAEAPAQQSVAVPVHQLSLKAWRNDAGLQAQLRKLIDNPVFLLARQSILDAAYPGVEPASKAEAHVNADAANNALAQRYAHRAGISYAFRMLRFLLTAPDTAIPASGHGQLLTEDE